MTKLVVSFQCLACRNGMHEACSALTATSPAAYSERKMTKTKTDLKRRDEEQTDNAVIMRCTCKRCGRIRKKDDNQRDGDKQK
jgi:hypothetical protein